MAQDTTKAQFLIDLAADNIVDAVATPVLDGTNDFGDNRYYVNVRKVSSNGASLNYENIQFFVVDEGGPNESTYFYKVDSVEFKNTQEQGDIV